jgi:Tol biopolymer transport system component
MFTRAAKVVFFVALTGFGIAGAALSEGTARSPAGKIAFVRYTARSGHPRVYTVRPRGGLARLLRLPVGASEGPAWSRDGRRIAFVAGSNRAGESHITKDVDLQVAAANGSGARGLTHDAKLEAAAAWSPDGRRIAFVRSGRGPDRSSIYVVDADGRHARPVTARSIDVEPSWAPNGRTIVFVRINPKTFVSGLWVVRPDGSHLGRILRRLRGATNPVWAPDGSRLLLSDGRTLFTVRPDGSVRKTIATLAEDSRGAREDPQPSWSADGTWVVFCQLRSGSVGGSDIWIVAADGTSRRRLTRSPGMDTDPSWAP